MRNFWNALKGAKTYIVAASGLLYAGAHYFIIGDMTSQQAIELALGSAGLGALRHGLSTQMVALIQALGPEALDAIKKNAGKAGAVVLLAVGLGASLSACTLTGNPSADLAAFGQQVQKFNNDFASKAAAFNAQVVATVVPAGKAACSFASELDGFYRSTAGQIGVQAGNTIAGGSTVDAAAINASEAATFAEVQKGCAIVDAIDPAYPTQAEITAVAALIQNVPQLQKDLAKLSPTAAALVAPSGS
jgi:hypothetical protein